MSEIKKNIEHGVDKTFICYVCQGSMAGAISTLTKNATKSVINPMLDVFFNFTYEKKGRREKGTEENSHFREKGTEENSHF